LSGLEAALVGLRPGREIDETVAAHGLAELSPIDDVRGSAEYRRAAAREIVNRALAGAFDGAGAEMAA
jgi:CO/xanthine dehydrogenase FAD-binding subunit